MAKRIMCLIISVLMIVSLLPSAAFATDETGEPTPVVESTGDVGEGEEVEEEESGEAEVVEAAEATEETTVSAAAQAVQSMIDALPTVDEVAAMDLDGQNEVYVAFLAACEAYDALTAEDQATVDDSALDTLADYFNGLTSVASSFPTEGALTTGTYTLTENVTLTGTLTVASGQVVTIDLNGYTISYTDVVLDATVYMITNSGTLTITDSSADGDGMLLMQATKTSTSTTSSNYSACVINNSGVLYLYGGTLKTTSVYKQARSVTIPSGGSNVVVNGTNIIVESSSSRQPCYGIYAGCATANVSMISGSISVSCTNENNPAGMYGIYGLTDGCAVSVSGGTIDVSGYSTNSAYVNGVYGFTTTTVSGGTITATNKSTSTSANAYGVRNSSSSSSKANITGGTITVTSTGGTAWGAGYANISGDATITADKLLGTCSVTGGTFNDGCDLNGTLADGCATVTNDDGTYTVASYKHIVTTAEGTVTGYSTLADALNAANGSSGSVIKMFADAGYSTSYWTVSGIVTIDLNGHTISSSPTSSSYGTLYVTGSLTLTDTAGGGYVKNNSSSTYGNAVRVNSGASFTMEGGTLTGKFGIYGAQNSSVTITGGTINATSTCAIQTLGGTVTITGTGTGEDTTYAEVKITNTATSGYGIRMYTNDGSVLNIDNPNTYISAKYAIGNSTSKTYEAHVTAGYYSTDVSNYVDDGYECVSNDDDTYLYTVQVLETGKAVVKDADGNTVSSHATLVQAVEAAENGQTVELLESMEGNGINLDTSEKSITIDLGGNTYTIVTGVGSSGTQTNGLRFESGGSVIIKNGTINPSGNNLNILIQNYCDLTLDGVTLDPSSTDCDIGLSCNSGTITLTGNTIITSTRYSSYIGLDVYYWTSNGYSDGVYVTIDEDFTGSISGIINYSSDGTEAGIAGVATYATLTIKAGTFYGSIVTANLNSSGDTGIEISGGHFAEEVLAEYCAEGYTPYTEAESTSYYTDGVPYTVTTFTLGVSNDSEKSVPATIASGEGTATMYVKVTSENIGSYTNDAYPTTSLTFGDDNTGYVFAGWYEDSEGTTTCSSVPSGDAYAKFVDENVLDVWVQITSGTSSTSEKTDMRLVSTVDTLRYACVGFEITLTQSTKTSTTSVYKQLVGSSGETVFNYDPEDICSISTYFMTYTIFNIPKDSFGTEMTIRAYWTTNDGTTVYGTARTVSVNSVM